MPAAGRLGGGAALWLLLAAQTVAAIDPVSVSIAFGVASVLTGYVTYTDLYCRFAECCPEKQRLNETGRTGRPAGARGAPGTGPAALTRGGGRERGQGPPSGLQPWKLSLLST